MTQRETNTPDQATTAEEVASERAFGLEAENAHLRSRIAELEDAAMNPDLKMLLTEAARCGQAANEAMNTIDQIKIDKGVWDALYQQGEALGALTSAVLMLADEKKP